MVPMLLLVSNRLFAYYYATCAHEMDQNPIDKNAAILRLKN